MSIRQKLLAISSALDSPQIQSLLLDVEQRLPARSQTSSTPTMHSQQVQQLIQQSFIDQCQLFLKDNSKFHQFTKKIEKKADEGLKEIEKVERYLQVKTSVNLQMEVKRVVERSQLNRERQEVMAVVGGCLQMPQHLVEALELQEGEQVEEQGMEQRFGNAIQFIMKQRELITQLSLSSPQSPLLTVLTSTNNQLASLATSKALCELKQLQSTSPALALIHKYDSLFKLNPQNHRQFVEAYVTWRVEAFRAAILPRLTPLDYSLQKTLQEHFREVMEAVGEGVRVEEGMVREVFGVGESGEGGEVMRRIWPEAAYPAYGKLQRNFLKSIDLLALVTIKKLYHQHIDLITSLFLPYLPNPNPTFQPQPLLSSLSKLLLCIQSQLKSESQKLTSAKYNIYSLSSYLGIAQHLKMAYECFVINRPYQASELRTTGFVQPFVDLAATREVNETNKSLVIFNVNIWEVYRQVWGKEIEVEDGKGEKMVERCRRVMDRCINIFIGMNMREVKNQWFQEQLTEQKKVLRQLLTICSADIKKTLHAQLSLIIHPNIRANIKQQLNQSFLKLYSQLAKYVPAMENQPLKKRCSQLDINIKSLGKAADSVRIYSAPQLQALLEN